MRVPFSFYERWWWFFLAGYKCRFYHERGVEWMYFDSTKIPKYKWWLWYKFGA